jgi:multidrug efflux pump subunit AcrB
VRNISAWAIRHPITPIVLFVVLFFFGAVAFVRLPINLNPDVSFPLVRVIVEQPGAAPSELETQIAQKVEGSISSIGNVRRIQTSITEGRVSIEVEFQIGTPVDRAVTDVRDAVAKVRNDLPQGIFEPQVQRENTDGGEFAIYAVSTTVLTAAELSWTVDNAITKRLLAVPGVAKVQRDGGVEREIRVELDPARMQAMGLTAVEVNDQLRDRRARPGRRRRAGDSRVGRREERLSTCRCADHRARRQIRALGRNRRGARRHRRSAQRGPARRPAGDRVFRVQGQGRIRCQHRCGSERGNRQNRG